jgi:hypothetical protein
MACKTVTLPPFKATLTERNPSTVAQSLNPSAPNSVELGLTTSERKYETVINQCTGDTTVFEVKSNGSKVAKITSNKSDNYVVKIVDKNESEIIKKSLITDVYKKGNVDKLRQDQIKTLPPEEIISNGLSRFTEPLEGESGDYAIDSEKLPQILVEGVPANTADKEFVQFPTKLFYPETLEENKFEQDFIRFKVINYKPRAFTTDGLKRLDRFDKTEKIVKSTIVLPIQGGISDSNMVNWNTDTMNAIEQAAGFTSLTLQQKELKEQFDNIKDTFEKLLRDKDSSAGISNYLHSFFARMSISSQSNFFSRSYGAILNPNLELLFQSPELRPFSFRFDLTPRNRNEAKQVRQIIRVFKQSMAARKGVADIFLKTPMIYEIEYINGKANEKHKSIGQMKTCALKVFNTNYTPSNQYMTYDDEDSTMTAYSLDMQFQELEPVYFDDYQKLSMNEIGF